MSRRPFHPSYTSSTIPCLPLANNLQVLPPSRSSCHHRPVLNPPQSHHPKTQALHCLPDRSRLSLGKMSLSRPLACMVSVGCMSLRTRPTLANTDTRHFWDLTKNLYRLTPARVTDSANVHTVDEVSYGNERFADL